MTIALETEHLRALADDMWTTLLTPPPEPADEVDFAGWTIASHIELVGGWYGCLQVETSVDGGAAIAGQMLDLPFADVNLPDLQDALGELANILGGSVKSCVEVSTALSLPQVGKPAPPVGEVESLLRVCSWWNGHPIVVTLADGAGEPVHDGVLAGGLPLRPDAA
jgi:chemotaxis protein CheX